MGGFSVEPGRSRDYLASNGAGLFLLIPTKQCRNEKQSEVQNRSKWHGLFLKTQKLLEGWNTEVDNVILSPENQTGFETDLSSVFRKFKVNDKEVVEEVFLPDKLSAFALTYSGNFESVLIQPEFDIRGRYSNNASEYETKIVEDAACISAENFFVYFGFGKIDFLDQYRYKKYQEDLERKDSAERWVYSPVKMESKKLFFGFGKSLAEAKNNFERIKYDLSIFKTEKRSKTASLLEKYKLNSEGTELDTAYSLAVRQLLSIKNDSLLPASGDRWFAGDEGWARDAAIALEAFFELGLFNDAKGILDFWIDGKKQREDGRLLNRINPLTYNSSDATLWLLRRLGEYVNLTNDFEFFRKKDKIARRVFDGIRKNYLSKWLVRSGPSETWMDTKFTPREGYPIEIQALFIYDCAICSKLFMDAYGDGLMELAKKCMESFKEFKISKKLGEKEWHFLADHITPDGIKTNLITPNQLIAIDCDLVTDELKKEILELVREKLAGVGIRSLAPEEKGYYAKHVGDQSYHRGTQWPWMNHLAAKAEISLGNKAAAYQVYIKPLVDKILRGNLGGVSEIYNGDGSECMAPHYQTWSLASFIVAAKKFKEAK